MGPPGAMHTLLFEQNDEVAKLMIQLEASLSRSSHLYTRLLSTLDKLDYLQAELNLERQKNVEQAVAKRIWAERLRELEAERDDMKEAIEFLIQKVERSHGDYQSWPSAKMYLPSPVEPSLSLGYSLLTPVLPPVTQTHSLVEIFASERQSHAVTQQNLRLAENQIAILRAKVARRETELESCNFRLDDFVPSSRSPHRREVKSRALSGRIATKFSQEDALNALEVTAQRNRTIQNEINTLTRLLQAKHSPNRPYSSLQSRCDIDNDPATQTSKPSSPSNRAPGPQYNGISDLKSQITRLAQAVDKFREERAILTKSIASANHTMDEIESIPVKRVLLIEEEYIRLKHLNDSMSCELKQLREENNRLRALDAPYLLTTSDGDTKQSPPSTSKSFDSPPSCSSKGERDMEISETPLIDTWRLPSMHEHEDETESLADFKFLSFDDASRPTERDTSTNVEPPSENVQEPIPSECGSRLEGLRTAHWEPKISDKPLDETDEAAKNLIMTPLSPTQIPLPQSPVSDAPSARMQQCMADSEREIMVVKDPRESEV